MAAKGQIFPVRSRQEEQKSTPLKWSPTGVGEPHDAGFPGAMAQVQGVLQLVEQDLPAQPGHDARVLPLVCRHFPETRIDPGRGDRRRPVGGQTEEVVVVPGEDATEAITMFTCPSLHTCPEKTLSGALDPASIEGMSERSNDPPSATSQGRERLPGKTEMGTGQLLGGHQDDRHDLTSMSRPQEGHLPSSR